LSFDKSHKEFIDGHISRRSGERLRRLKDGHSHAEKLFLEYVWWPAFGHFDNLHPEYEIYDFRDGSRYLDFALLTTHIRLALEIDGYGPHLNHISRKQFSDQWVRQNHLIIDGWKILRFSYDDVKDRPRMCEQLLQQFMGRWCSGHKRIAVSLSAEEKDIIRLAAGIHSFITPKDVCSLLGVEQQKARKLLHGLIEKKIMLPGKNSSRISRYTLSTSVSLDDLMM
jgi:ribosomal protein S25